MLNGTDPSDPTAETPVAASAADTRRGRRLILALVAAVVAAVLLVDAPLIVAGLCGRAQGAPGLVECEGSSGRDVPERLERAMGIEPTTFSLGS